MKVERRNIFKHGTRKEMRKERMNEKWQKKKERKKGTKREWREITKERIKFHSF